MVTLTRYESGHKQQQVVATEGRDRCDIKLHRPIPFLSGRVDCQPDPAKKWTPYDFEATEVERQSNPRGTGNQVLQDLKQDFGLTARAQRVAVFNFGTNRVRVLEKIFRAGLGMDWVRVFSSCI